MHTKGRPLCCKLSRKYPRPVVTRITSCTLPRALHGNKLSISPWSSHWRALRHWCPVSCTQWPSALPEGTAAGPSGPRGHAAASCRIKHLITNDQSANILRSYLNSPTSLRLFTSDILASEPRLSTIGIELCLDFNFSYGIIRAHFCIIGIASQYGTRNTHALIRNQGS